MKINHGGTVYEVNLRLWGGDFKRKEEILVRWKNSSNGVNLNNCKLT